jgi:hypothetical protein
MFEKCKNNTGPHGKSPVYMQKSYVWMDVYLLDYDPASNKFLVKVASTG